MTYYQSLLGGHIAVFFMGITGVLAAVSGFDAWHVTSYRVTLGGVVLLLALKLKAARPPISRRHVWITLGMGVLLSVHWYTFFLSLEMLGVMLGMAMTGTQPLLIALMARFVLGERLSRRTTIALCISLIGFVILGLAPSSSGQVWQGIAVSVFSFLLFAILILFNRSMVQHTSALLVTTLEMVGAIPLTLVMTLPHWAPQTGMGWVWALVLGVLCTGFAYVLYNGSMKVLPAPVAGLVLSLEVVYGLVGGFLIGDTLTLLQGAAALLISSILFFDISDYITFRITGKKAPSA